MRDRKILVLAIAVVIAGLLISSSVPARKDIGEKEKKIEISWHKEVSISSEVSFIKNAEKLNDNPYNKISADPLFFGQRPTITNGASNILLGFENSEEENTYFTYSADGGNTWAEGAWGWDIGVPELPSVDYSHGSQFYGTVVPDWTTSGFVTLMDFEDITNPDETWTAGTWDWEDNGIYGFEGASIASAEGDQPYKWGFITLSGYNGYNENNADGCPYTMYATGEDYATISWLVSGETGEVLEDCAYPSNDLDSVKDFNYGVWERFNGEFYNIEIRKDDYTYDPEVGSPFESAGELVTDINDRYPDVSAFDDNVIVVAQTDSTGNNDIICYYSTDGMETFEANLIASSSSDEEFPRIVAIGENEAICTYISNSDLYYVTTSNGGASWDSPEKINDDSGIVSEEYHSSDVCEIGAAFGDNEEVVYFGALGSSAVLTIDSVTGGLGVSAVIKNIGGADAVNVPYSITATGGILGLINKENSGTISITAGGQDTISLPIIIGLGAITIEVSIGPISETYTGTQLLIFTNI